MFDVRIEGIEGLKRDLEGFSQRRLNAALATALTRTAAQVREDVQAGAQASLDRPTPYTLRQLRYVGATAQRLVAGVGFNIAAVTDERGVVTSYRDLGPGETPAGRYLPPQISGGAREHKRMERVLQRIGVLPPGWFAMPGAGAPLDSYGNVSPGLVRQVLSQLRAEPTSGATSALPELSRADVRMVARSTRGLTPAERALRKDALARRSRIVAAQRRAGGQFFVVPRGAKSSLKPGIYQREFMGRDIRPIFVFVSSATYRPRFDFYGIAQRSSSRLLAGHVERAIEEQRQRLAASRGASA